MKREKGEIWKKEMKEELERDEQKKNSRALFLKNHSQIQNFKNLSFYLK